jgi:hypothetical protein
VLLEEATTQFTHGDNSLIIEPTVVFKGTASKDLYVLSFWAKGLNALRDQCALCAEVRQPVSRKSYLERRIIVVLIIDSYPRSE